MSKTLFPFLSLLSFLLLSCNDKDDMKLTKIEGKPSKFEQNDKTSITFSYQNGQIAQIKGNNGSASTFMYQNNMLSEIIISPPKDVMDGNGATRFKKEGENVIRVESWGEPSSYLYVKEMEWTDNSNTVKITDIGVFSPDQGGYEKVMDGKNRVLITWDPVTKNILKREVYNLENNEIEIIAAYEYDNYHGTMSHIDWPDWLFIYMCNNYSNLYDAAYRQFFNHKNNLVKETVNNKKLTEEYTVDYTYTYNKNGYPVTAVNNYNGNEKSIKITY